MPGVCSLKRWFAFHPQSLSEQNLCSTWRGHRVNSRSPGCTVMHGVPTGQPSSAITPPQDLHSPSDPCKLRATMRRGMRSPAPHTGQTRGFTHAFSSFLIRWWKLTMSSDCPITQSCIAEHASASIIVAYASIEAACAPFAHAIVRAVFLTQHDAAAERAHACVPIDAAARWADCWWRWS